jgi:hypothetical protein
MPTSEAEAAFHALSRAAEAVRHISAGLTTPQSGIGPSRKEVVRTPQGSCLADDVLRRELVFILRSETNFEDLVNRLADLIAAAKEAGGQDARQHFAEYMEVQARHLRRATTRGLKGSTIGEGTLGVPTWQSL